MRESQQVQAVVSGNLLRASVRARGASDEESGGGGVRRAHSGRGLAAILQVVNSLHRAALHRACLRGWQVRAHCPYAVCPRTPRCVAMPMWVCVGLRRVALRCLCVVCPQAPRCVALRAHTLARWHRGTRHNTRVCASLRHTAHGYERHKRCHTTHVYIVSLAHWHSV